jgi:glutathione synthase/RimK-type ligase-like ATP-grasp enzyme
MEADDNIGITRRDTGDINWGKRVANTILNPDTSNVANKRKMRLLFAEHGVPMPKLYTLHEAHAKVKEGRLIVGRPDKHSKGRGLWRVNSNDSFMRAMRGTRKKRAATHFMEWVEAPREYRVHIFKGRSIRISEKKFGEKGVTSTGNYVTIKPTEPIGHVRRAAKKAVEAVGLDFGAVDILADDENCWVLEVNSAPGLGGSLPRLYAQVFRNWAEENDV